MKPTVQVCGLVQDRGGNAWRIDSHWYIEPSVEPRVLFYFVLKNGGKCGIMNEALIGVQIRI